MFNDKNDPESASAAAPCSAAGVEETRSGEACECGHAHDGMCFEIVTRAENGCEVGRLCWCEKR